MSEQRLNIELFKKVREKIATTPEAYDQRVFGRSEPLAPCGTAACIAGWACVLSGVMRLDDVQLANPTDTGQTGIIDLVDERAAEALRLTDYESDVLFTSEPEGDCDDYDDDGNDIYAGGWPEPFAEQWREAVSNDARAQVAVAYLDHIIETGKVLE